MDSLLLKGLGPVYALLLLPAVPVNIKASSKITNSAFCCVLSFHVQFLCSLFWFPLFLPALGVHYWWTAFLLYLGILWVCFFSACWSPGLFQGKSLQTPGTDFCSISKVVLLHSTVSVVPPTILFCFWCSVPATVRLDMDRTSAGACTACCFCHTPFYHYHLPALHLPGMPALPACYYPTCSLPVSLATTYLPLPAPFSVACCLRLRPDSAM